MSLPAITEGHVSSVGLRPQFPVQLIGSVRTREGLTVKAKLDTHVYPTGIKVSDTEMDSLLIATEVFHGEWNYTVHTRRTGIE